MENIRRNSVLVVGDIILDKYIHGEVARISPEAPVPVLKADFENNVLGGVANVANNIAALDCKVSIIGTLGKDENGEKVLSLLMDSKIDISNINCSEKYKTLVKKRVVANKQQLIRLDYNDDVKPTSNDIATMLENMKNRIDDYDVVIISDYDKGVCTEELCAAIIKLCSEKNKIVIVDPKGNNWEKYMGATIITPNLKEISVFLKTEIKNSDDEIEKKCKGVCNILGIQYILITRSEKGMTLIDTNNTFIHIPAQAKEVFDVSGAGDTVVATLSCFVGNTVDIEQAVNLANIAAGIVVSKFGTSIVTLDEINEVIMNKKSNQIFDKIMDINKLMWYVDKWKKNGEQIVFTNGCYDVFHKGHVHSIYSAAELGAHLIVAINSDGSVKRIKGNDRPINSEFDRAYVMAAMGCVDAVIIFAEDTPEKILSMIRPNILVKGSDYKVEEVIGKKYADKVELIEYIYGYSTTSIINKMNR